MNSSDRVEYLYSGRSDQPYNANASAFQYISQRYQDTIPIQPAFSTASESSSWVGLRRTSDSGYSSVSSNATSIPPNPPPAPAYAYSLPCEFDFTGCRIQFDPPSFEHFYTHSISHFSNRPPPSKAICTFCNDDSAIFESHGDRYLNWRNRLLHIARHYSNLQTESEQFPDFWVIEYLRKHHLINKKDYDTVMKYTERPSGCDVVRRDHKTNEMIRRDYLDSKVPVALDQEDRWRRKHQQEPARNHRRSHKH